MVLLHVFPLEFVERTLSFELVLYLNAGLFDELLSILQIFLNYLSVCVFGVHVLLDVLVVEIFSLALD